MGCHNISTGECAPNSSWTCCQEFEPWEDGRFYSQPGYYTKVSTGFEQAWQLLVPHMATQAKHPASSSSYWAKIDDCACGTSMEALPWVETDETYCNRRAPDGDYFKVCCTEPSGTKSFCESQSGSVGLYQGGQFCWMGGQWTLIPNKTHFGYPVLQNSIGTAVMYYDPCAGGMDTNNLGWWVARQDLMTGLGNGSISLTPPSLGPSSSGVQHSSLGYMRQLAHPFYDIDSGGLVKQPCGHDTRYCPACNKGTYWRPYFENTNKFAGPPIIGLYPNPARTPGCTNDLRLYIQTTSSTNWDGYTLDFAHQVAQKACWECAPTDLNASLNCIYPSSSSLMLPSLFMAPGNYCHYQDFEVMDFWSAPLSSGHGYPQANQQDCQKEYQEAGHGCWKMIKSWPSTSAKLEHALNPELRQWLDSGNPALEYFLPFRYETCPECEPRYDVATYGQHYPSHNPSLAGKQWWTEFFSPVACCSSDKCRPSYYINPADPNSSVSMFPAASCSLVMHDGVLSSGYCCTKGEPYGDQYDYSGIRAFNATLSAWSKPDILCGKRTIRDDRYHIDYCIGITGMAQAMTVSTGIQHCTWFWFERPLGRKLNNITRPAGCPEKDPVCCGIYQCPNGLLNVSLDYILGFEGCTDYGGIYWPTPAGNFIYYSNTIKFGALTGDWAWAYNMVNLNPPCNGGCGQNSHVIRYMGQDHCVVARLLGFLPPGSTIRQGGGAYGLSQAFLPGATYVGTPALNCADCLAGGYGI